MYIKKLIEEKIWVMGIVLAISILLTLNNFYFISNVIQNVYYGVYVVLCIATSAIIRKRYSISIHHGFLILLNLFLIYVTLVNHFIAVPLILIFPLFYFSKSHWIFKAFSTISYILLLIIMLLILFVRLFFTSTTLVKTVASPNNKQLIEVYSIDEGALGGSTHVYLADKYWHIFKKNRIIYSGGYVEANEVKWIDSNHIQIDNRSINITSQ